MKITSASKRRYYKLDEVGFVGSQEKRSARKIKLDAVRTSRVIQRLTDEKVLKSSPTSSHHKKMAKKVHA